MVCLSGVRQGRRHLKRAGTRRLTLVLIVCLATAGAAGLDSVAKPDGRVAPHVQALSPDDQVAGQVPLVYRDLYVPLNVSRFEGPYPTARALPSYTPTRTQTPLPTLTPSITPTPGPSPTPTLPPVGHPDDPETIILQVGWSDTNQPGHTWEEMNGTPFFTLYGDGRLIGGHVLFNWRQRLYEGRVDEAQIQDWLRRLTYGIGFFRLEAEYEHPDYTKLDAHVYVRYGPGGADYGRVSIGGFTEWLSDEVPYQPDVEAVKQLAEFVKELETFSDANLVSEHYPEHYTVLSMEVNRYLPSPPEWENELDIIAISDSAPRRRGGGYVHGPPGHLVVDSEQGLELWDYVTNDARRDWPGLNQAAEYLAGGRRFVVGVRQEVPGESPFLPAALREEWYRKD